MLPVPVAPPPVPAVPPPADLAAILALNAHPVARYLARLQSDASRRTMLAALHAVARALRDGTFDAITFPWGTLTALETADVPHRLRARPRPGRPGGGPLAHTTVNKVLSALRGVIREGRRLGLYSAEAAAQLADVDAVRGERVLSGRSIERGELRALFDACSEDASPRGARDAALLACLYGAGLRRAEVVALTLAQVDLAKGALRVRGKGNKERLTYLSTAAEQALRAWLAVRETVGTAPAGPLFLPVTRGRHPRLLPRRMSAQTVYDVLTRRAAEAKIGERLSPHDFRRTFIGDLLDAGADVSTVQRLAGHATVQTTVRYDRRGERAKRDAAHLLHVPYTPHRPPR